MLSVCATFRVEMHVNHPKLKLFLDKVFNATFHPNTDRSDVTYDVEVRSYSKSVIIIITVTR